MNSTNENNKIPSSERRDFLKLAAGTGVAVGVAPWLASCGGGGGGGAAATGAKDMRTHYFDLSNADPNANYFLVAGTTHHPITPVTPDMLAAARASNPLLQQVSDAQITHVASNVPLPGRNIQMLYVKGVSTDPNVPQGAWTMHQMFYHIPSTTVDIAARDLALSCGKKPDPTLLLAFSNCVGTGAQARVPLAALDLTYCTDPRYDNYKSYFDHAVALVCHHPEIGSFDAPTLNYVQQHIICSDANILNLAVSLFKQGPASTSGGWATLIQQNDPDTGQAKLGSNGQILYFVQHSAETLRLTGLAIRSILPKVKNDITLGANITHAQPGPGQTNPDLQGKLWAVRNGSPTVSAPTAAARLLKAIALGRSASTSWAASDVSSGNGLSIKNVTGTDQTVSFTIENWYLRYVGLYIRYLDAAGNPIPYASLPANIQGQFRSLMSKDKDCFLDLVNQELVILGIPIKENTQTFSIEVPSMAASVQILAGGLGRGTNSYPNTVAPGAVMTVVLDLAIPGLFLAMAAATAYGTFSEQMATAGPLLVSTSQIFMQAITDAALVGVYGDPQTFTNVLMPLGGTLVKSAKELYAVVTENLAAGEAEGVAEDCIPFGIGLIIQAVMAAGTLASMAETSAEVANSPWTYVTEVKATHNLTVTINHDPTDTAGFPAVATHYRLLAACDGSSPYDSGDIVMSCTTQTAPLIYTFQGLPSGGRVNVTVAFYSSDGWLAGGGSTGSIDNTLDSASITITENKVPLTVSTVYSHKQKIATDVSGNLVWKASTTPPATTSLNCNNSPGSLCNLVGITLSEPFGAIGYAWEAYSQNVTDFASGATGQMYQFANLSFTQNPQSGYMTSGGGFRAPARVAYNLTSPTSKNYYIDTSNGSGIVRRINMTAVGTPPTMDSPSSNLAVGKFNFSSDAFLVHPTGKLISINSALAKLEVLVPATTPVADANAPLAQAYSGTGTREGLLRGPSCMGITPAGAILVIEQMNNRIQAFDTGANPTQIFAGNTSSIMPLQPVSPGTTYLDLAVEFVGYIYVLSVNSSNTYPVYTMDIYDPNGVWLTATSGLNAGKLAVDLFRNVYTLNYDPVTGADGITQPSISEWIPSPPPGGKPAVACKT